jgi:seryl-tRNA synthetase
MAAKPELSDRISSVENLLRAWSQGRGGKEHQWPVLMRDDVLRRAGYPAAFPHLLMTACVEADPENQPRTLSRSGWCLSPTVCYHAYAALEGQVIGEGVRLSARGHCFRNEIAEDLIPGRRQIEFQMRELILIGTPEWIEDELAGVTDEVAGLALPLGLNGRWEVASDPFFLPIAEGKARMQRLLETKREFCLPDGLAIASINRHGPFFGERFRLALPDGQVAHSACVAFGLDRWAAHSKTFELCQP